MFSKSGNLFLSTFNFVFQWKSDPSQMMDSKLKCVFVMPPSAQNLGVSSGGAENNGDDASVRSEYTAAASSQMRANIPPSPKVRTEERNVLATRARAKQAGFNKMHLFAGLFLQGGECFCGAFLHACQFGKGYSRINSDRLLLFPECQRERQPHAEVHRGGEEAPGRSQQS